MQSLNECRCPTTAGRWTVESLVVGRSSPWRGSVTHGPLVSRRGEVLVAVDRYRWEDTVVAASSPPPPLSAAAPLLATVDDISL